MRMHLSGMGTSEYLPMTNASDCIAAGGTWNPSNPDRGYDPTGARQCLADSVIPPVDSTGSPAGPGTTPIPVPGASCGDPNTCTWWDQIWVRDDCLNYLRCASPSDPRVIAMSQGFFTGAGAAVGSAAGSTLRGTLGGLLQNSDGSTNWVMLGIIGATVALLVLKK